MIETDEVLVRDEGKVRWITLNRPETKNGLTFEVNERLTKALKDAATSNEVRVVALTGSGGSFCSGLDLKAAASLASEVKDKEATIRSHFHSLIRAVRACPKPVIALVDGAAAGFGCDLALACDVRLCSDRARFGEIFVKRGLMPDGGSSYHLARLVGVGRALDLLFTGDIVDADEAYRIGLANRVVPSAEFETFAQGYLQRLAGGPPAVFRLIKEAVYGAQGGTLDTALELEARGQAQLLGSKDFFEGVNAFFAKRTPNFTGE
jgi:enoyl-CoA hydratase/carnithine racemase